VKLNDTINVSGFVNGSAHARNRSAARLRFGGRRRRITRAGERVHRTQSTVSQQIRRLEERLGRELLRCDLDESAVVGCWIAEFRVLVAFG
jgi:hypothetical protein